MILNLCTTALKKIEPTSFEVDFLSSILSFVLSPSEMNSTFEMIILKLRNKPNTQNSATYGIF